MGTVLNRKKKNKTGTATSKMNLDAFPFHFKSLNFNDSMGMLETIR